MFHSAQGNETTMTGQETLLSRICAGGIVENPRLPLPELEYTPKLCKTVPSNIAMDCSYGSYGVDGPCIDDENHILAMKIGGFPKQTVEVLDGK